MDRCYLQTRRVFVDVSFVQDEVSQELFSFIEGGVCPKLPQSILGLQSTDSISFVGALVDDIYHIHVDQTKWRMHKTE